MNPLKVKATGSPITSANISGLQTMTDAEVKNYIANVITEKFAAVTDGTGTAEINITTDNSGSGVSIGTFADTTRTEAIGTHPATGAITTNTYYAKQVTASAAESITNRPLAWDSRLEEMTDSDIDGVMDLCIEAMVTESSYTAGQYKLQPSAPSGGTWVSRYTITDTAQGGNTTTYLWQKTVSSSAPNSDYTPLKLFNGSNCKQMVETEIEQLLPNFRNRIIETGIGTYKIQSTAPVSGGTWVEMGSEFSDTREQITPQAYVGNYSGTFSSNFSGTYGGTANYSGNYSGGGNFAGPPYSGVAPVAYTGYYQGPGTPGSSSGTPYTGYYQGPGTPGSSSGTPYTGYYTGPGYTGPGYTAPSPPAVNYTGFYTGFYAGILPGGPDNYAGYYQGAPIPGPNYTGFYAGVIPGGTYTGYYQSSIPYVGFYTGTRTFTGVYTGGAEPGTMQYYTSYFTGLAYFTPYYNGPGGPVTYTGFYTRIFPPAIDSYTGYYTGFGPTGFFAGPAVAKPATYTSSYLGVAPGAPGLAYTGFYSVVSPFAGVYNGPGPNYTGYYGSGPTPANFTGYYAGPPTPGPNYTGFYAGISAPQPGNFTGYYTGYYAGGGGMNPTYVGPSYSGVFAGTYIGAPFYASPPTPGPSYSGTYIGAPFYGTPPSPGPNYTGYYMGLVPANYTGFYSGPGGNYTGFYSGPATYTGFYSGSFINTFSGNYSGATIQATKDTVSTIKLWIRTN